jgi:GxxExxY protein
MRWSWSLGYGGFHLSSRPAFDVLYKGQRVGAFVPDLIVFDSIVVDSKVIDRITDHERGLMLNCLRITALRVGVILNFKHRKLEWERIVL